MTEFAEWLNTGSEISPVLIAGISQYQFVHIHPFLDGNGRTATRDFTDLVNIGLLERHGEKKGTYYTLKLFEGQ
jgi:Fic family protein